MDTSRVRKAFTGLVDDVDSLTERNRTLATALCNMIAVVTQDEVYLAAVARPGESQTACGARLVREAHALLPREGN